MASETEFGQCLYLLLSALNISCNRLGKAINVDPSLVNRWIHEKRIPNYHTNHINNISEYLSNSILNSLQERQLKEIIHSIHGAFEKDVDIKYKIRKVLLECQCYSLENKKSLHIENKKSKDDKVPSFNPIPLSKEDTIIIGNDNILNEGFSLIKNAIKETCTNNHTIYISFNINKHIVNNENHLNYLEKLFLKALKNGWSIVLLLNLDTTIDKSIRFINSNKPLMETGRFHLYYFKKYNSIYLNTAAIIVPDFGALCCISSGITSEPDYAFSFKNKTAVDILKNAFNSAILEASKPLIKHYNPYNNNEYDNLLVENDSFMGKGFLFKESFSLLTLPPNIFEKLLIQKNLSHSEMQKNRELYNKRLKGFLTNIKLYEHIDIYSMISLENLIKYRQISFNVFDSLGTVILQTEEVIDYLKNLVYLLKKHENYKIAFINRSNFNRNHINYNFKVKERHSVIIETWEPLNNTPTMRISIDEPTFIKAFEDYFKEIWNEISPVYKDKSEIIKWLENEISLLEKVKT